MLNVCIYKCINTSFLQVIEKGVILIGSSFVDSFITPKPFPLSVSRKSSRIIAPYWADIDTSGIGIVYYRQTTDPSLLARATSEIRAAFPWSPNVTIRNLLIATWEDVGYFSQGIDKVHCIVVQMDYCMYGSI